MGAAIARELAADGFRLALISPSGVAEELARSLHSLGVTRWVTERGDLNWLHRATLDLVRNYSFATDDLAGWPRQVYIIESDDDRAIRPKARAAVRSLYPQAQVYTFRGGGHTPGYNNPPEYRDLLAGFLD